jgi:hypothetical protein
MYEGSSQALLLRDRDRDKHTKRQEMALKLEKLPNNVYLLTLTGDGEHRYGK